MLNKNLSPVQIAVMSLAVYVASVIVGIVISTLIHGELPPLAVWIALVVLAPMAVVSAIKGLRKSL